jgi:hypothetical protein
VEAALLQIDAKTALLQTATQTTLTPFTGVTATDVQTGLQQVFAAISANPVVTETGVVENIAALKTVLKTKYKAVVVKGYTVAGDKGGGVYEFMVGDTSTADDGGINIVANDGGRWRLQYSEGVLAQQFGAKGDGTTDDTAALQKGINACSALNIKLYLSGWHLTSSTLFYTKNTKIEGVTPSVKIDAVQGSGNTDTTFQKNNGIMVNNATTILKNINGGLTEGVSFREFAVCPADKRDARLTFYTAAPAYSANYIGIDVNWMSEGECVNIIGKNLDSVIYTSGGTINVDATVLRVTFDGVGGYNNNIVINLYKSGSTGYATGDCVIKNIIMTRMNNQAIAVGRADGITITNCKFFQAVVNNIYIAHTNFVNMNGCTVFETNNDNVFMEYCSEVIITGTIISRAGWYTGLPFYIKSANIRLAFCENVRCDLLLERATGYNYVLDSCNTVKFTALTQYAWFAQGGLTDGLVQNCLGVDLDVTCRNNADPVSATGSINVLASDVSGTITSDPPWTFQLNSDNLDLKSAKGKVLHTRVVGDQSIAPFGSVELARTTVTVPAGRVLKVFNVDFYSGVSAQLRVNTYFDPNTVSDTRVLGAGEGIIYDNSGSSQPRVALVVLYAFNPTSGYITVYGDSPFGASLILN